MIECQIHSAKIHALHGLLELVKHFGRRTNRNFTFHIIRRIHYAVGLSLERVFHFRLSPRRRQAKLKPDPKKQNQQISQQSVKKSLKTMKEKQKLMILFNYLWEVHPTKRIANVKGADQD